MTVNKMYGLFVQLSLILRWWNR